MSEASAQKLGIGYFRTMQSEPIWSLPRPNTGTRIVAQFATDHGMPLTECLSGSGIEPADLHNENREIWADQEFAVIRNVLARFGDQPGLGFRIGLKVNLGNMASAGFAMLSSATVRDAITVGIRYQALNATHLEFALEEDGDEALLVASDVDIPSDIRCFITECNLSPIISGLMVGLPLRRLELRMDAESGVAFATSELLVGVEVHFGRPRNLLAWDRDFLDHPMPQADELTARMLERQCRELLRRRREARGTAAVIRSRLLRDPSRIPGLDTLARELHVDERTLRRRLAKEGTSFRTILDQVLQKTAADLLTRGNLPVAEVAHRLGYADTSAFTHAFTRWHGEPPSRYRRRA